MKPVVRVSPLLYEFLIYMDDSYIGTCRIIVSLYRVKKPILQPKLQNK